MFHRRWKQGIAIALVSCALAGCGGGSGGGSPPPPPSSPPPPPPPTFTLGGSVSGLVGSVTLQNTGGAQLTVSANGAFTFAATVAAGSNYNVTVATQPELQACTVANGSGTASANVTNIAISCADTVLPPTLSLSVEAIKAFRFAWSAVPGITRYRLFEAPTGGSGFTQVGADIDSSVTSLDHIVPLYRRVNARYVVQACAATRCIDSNIVSASGSLADAVGYFKSESISAFDHFGTSVALSADGTTLAVGALPSEDSNAPDSAAVHVFVRNDAGPTWVQQARIEAPNGGDADQFAGGVALDSSGATLAVAASAHDGTGAVYVFERSNGVWTERTVLKASNAEFDDRFGDALTLSGDGTTLAVGAPNEDSAASEVDGDESDNSADDAGAVYVFVEEGPAWRQEAYIKASNADDSDRFGFSVALSQDGTTLAVGARFEDSEATGVGGEQFDEGALDSGAVYVFTRDAQWTQQEYIKASNTGEGDTFGTSLALSADGSTLAVGANLEDSAATGVNGDQNDNTVESAGAAYVFVRLGDTWTQQAYIKASSTAVEANVEGDFFGTALALSADGSTLAVGAALEDSSAVGIGGDDSDNSAEDAGAVYVFERSNDAWAQRAYVKPSNTSSLYFFGEAIALSGDGATLAAASVTEPGSSPGINGNQNTPPIEGAGAVYVY
jgi:hypothetical protein